jgi:hypothetical protein
MDLTAVGLDRGPLCGAVCSSLAPNPGAVTGGSLRRLRLEADGAVGTGAPEGVANDGPRPLSRSLPFPAGRGSGGSLARN